MPRRLALVAMLALLGGGCGIVTGQSLGAWSGDKAMVANVKSAIVAVRLRNLTHVNVDVYDRVVYLTGTVRDAAAKEETEAAARRVEGVRYVVSHLVERHKSEPPLAALPAATMSRPVPSVLRGVARLDGHLAYDANGRLVASVYTVAMEALAEAAPNRFAGERPADHVTIHAVEADADVPVPHYLIVLWYVRDAETGEPR